ncbi:MAG: hypothetical protein M1840_001572 [Geoglossum simile]|nr:MAG: hypothetical protein M1840_001572 [Geoglossum simile]
MPSSCKDIRTALAECLQNSDCIMVSRHTPADCLRPPLLETLPTRCQQLKHGYGMCKRGLVDMRKRFRGNHPIGIASGGADSGVEEHGEPAGQLYAGRPAFGKVVNPTDGKEEDAAGGRTESR